LKITLAPCQKFGVDALYQSVIIAERIWHPIKVAEGQSNRKFPADINIAFVMNWRKYSIWMQIDTHVK
jgi:hypothetical protein